MSFGRGHYGSREGNMICQGRGKRLRPLLDHLVKNGFSDPTKEQIGWDQHRKDITNDCLKKALEKGCHERE